jgi:hypothetical protein
MPDPMRYWTKFQVNSRSMRGLLGGVAALWTERVAQPDDLLRPALPGYDRLFLLSNVGDYL